MSYRAPVPEMLFTLRHVTGLDGVEPEDAEAILTEAGRIAAGVLAPLNRVGDRHGTPFTDGRVTTPPGWREAYRTFTEGGWNGLSAESDHGGQGLPKLIEAACTEMWNGANLAFGLCPLLTQGGIEALAAHGSDD